VDIYSGAMDGKERSIPLGKISRCEPQDVVSAAEDRMSESGPGKQRPYITLANSLDEEMK